MADVPLLRAVSHSHHSQDGEILDFTLQFADGSATKFEVPARFPLPALWAAREWPRSQW